MSNWAEKGLDWLEALGVNVTRLRWRLYKVQRKAEAAKDGPKLPASLQWMAYQHKKCTRCGAINARDDKRCTECDARLPSMGTYRVMRLLGLTTPATSPQIVYGFIGVIGLMFMLMLAMNPDGIWRFTRYTALTFGAFAPIFLHYPGEWWRILGFGIIHGGIIHIAFNAFALSQVGPVVEGQLARARMLVVVTVTQLAAALATYFWYGMMTDRLVQTTVGASGWLFGLIGFGIVYLQRHGGDPMHRQALIQWAMYGAVFGLLMPGINNAAHIGGFLGGAAMAMMPMHGRMKPREMDAIWNALAVICAVLWVVSLVFLAHSVFTGWSPGGDPPD